MSSLADGTTRTIQIVQGSPLTTFTSPNKFTYRLPASGYQTGRDEIALKGLTVYYSWANISAAKGNTSYSYTWDGTVYPVVLDDGIYSFEQWVDVLHQVMVTNGHYLVDDTGNNVYYIDVVVNEPLYCLSLTVSPLPLTLPTDWTNPASLDLTALNGYGPQLTIPAGLVTFTGFPAATYPAAAQTTIYQVNSGIPQITDAQAINLRCSIANDSGFSLTPDILSTFTYSGVTAGSLISHFPSNLDWVPTYQNQNFNEIEVSLTDQRGRALALRDTQGFVCLLCVRRKN